MNTVNNVIVPPEVQKLKEDLSAFASNRESLSSPVCTLRYFIDDYAIFATEMGYYFKELEKSQREFYFYDQYTNIKYLTHGDEMPASIWEQIPSLEELDKKLKPFGLFAVCFDKESDEYTLCYHEYEVYVAVCAQDTPFINEKTLEYCKTLELNKPAFPHMIYLENDGNVLS